MATDADLLTDYLYLKRGAKNTPSIYTKLMASGTAPNAFTLKIGTETAYWAPFHVSDPYIQKGISS